MINWTNFIKNLKFSPRITELFIEEVLLILKELIFVFFSSFQWIITKKWLNTLSWSFLAKETKIYSREDCLQEYSRIGSLNFKFSSMP